MAPVFEAPQSYDPPGSTVTTGRAITAPVRRTFSFSGGNGRLWVDADFDGARASGVTRMSDSEYVVTVTPENAPINNSPWYAFRIWSDRLRTVSVRLRYIDGDHRYHPRVSIDGRSWTLLERSAFVRDTLGNDRIMTLRVGPDTLWVSAQELKASEQIYRWADRMAGMPWIVSDTVGVSLLGRPIVRLIVGEGKGKEYVYVVGRQHPPEVTGSIALEEFVEAVAGPTDLARRFRERYTLVVLPLLNPDGVDGGHWRHSAAGIDLNRDWYAFNQPETRAARNAFLKLRDSLGARPRFALDFHSTWSDIIYTLDSSLTTDPPGFTSRWIEELEWLVPGYVVREEPANLESPIFKSWFYREFGAPVVTYEVGDGISRDRLSVVAASAAEAMMKLLLEE